MKRDASIDTGRGLLVLLMLYGHTLQFFGDGQIFPAVNTLIGLINLLVFPSFVYFFGRTVALAYLSKPYRKALPGMLKTFLRTLCAFWVSGIAFRVLRENKALAVGTVRRVLLLQDIPGWSEFLISFALYALLTLVAFAGLKAVGRRMWLGLVVCAVCLGCTFLPYGEIPSTYLGLVIGGTGFSYFPIVQYMPYFLAGILYTQGDKRRRLWLLGIAAVCGVAGSVYTALAGEPSRFPPHWAWILTPALGVAALSLLCTGLHRIGGAACKYVSGPVTRFLGSIGGKSLYYLLCSNLILFTMSGKGLAPSIARKSVLPWTLPIQSPTGALCWCAVMVLSLMFVASLASRGAAPGSRLRA